MLSKLVENKGRESRDWDRLLGPVLFSYQTTPHLLQTRLRFSYYMVEMQNYYRL